MTSKISSEVAVVDILQIQDEIDLLTHELDGRAPMQNSSLKAFCKKEHFWNVFNFDRGKPLLSTFFSGGTINHYPHFYIQNLLALKATDICEDVIMTDNEIVSNAYGFKTFFELDYRTDIPTFKTMMKHISTAQNLLKEVFKACDTTVFISTSEKKIKKISKTGEKTVAFGVHLVFPHIIIDTAGLKRLAVTLDSRITKDNYIWSGVVDAASIHARHASLRPNFSYKMGPCPIHAVMKKSASKLTGRPLNREEKKQDDDRKASIAEAASLANGGKNMKKVAPKKPSKKQKRKKSMKKAYEEFGKEYYALTDDDDDKSDEDDILILDDIKCAKCVFGKVVLPSTYRLESVLKHDGSIIDYTCEGNENITVYDELKLTTIIFVGCTSEINILTGREDLPLDFAEELDVLAPKKGAVFSKEKTTVHAAKRRPNSSYLSFGNSVFNLIVPLLARVHETYRNVCLQNIMLDKDRKSLIINVKGSSSRHCCLIDRKHSSNRVYFIVLLATGYIQSRCFDSDCTKRRKDLFPVGKAKKTQKPFSLADQVLQKTLSTKIPEDIWKDICKAVNVPYKNSSYCARSSNSISPVSSITLTTSTKGKKRGKDEVEDEADCVNPKRLAPVKEVKLAEVVTGDDALAQMLAVFDLPRSERLKFADNDIFKTQ